MGINEKLLNIQKDLKCNKSQYNSFGKYHYRSCEDILESVKPLLAREKCCLVITDDVLCMGDRIYLKAIAKISDCESGESISNCAFAREPNTKKGQDESQITGTSSSYARKYCLNGLFLIDDTKDADTDEYRTQAENQYKAQQDKPKGRPKKVNENQIQTLCNLIDRKGKTLEEMLSLVAVGDVRDLTAETYNKIVLALKDA